MEVFKLFNVVFCFILFSVTISLIIVMCSLRDSVGINPNTLCLNLDGTLECQHSVSGDLNKQLERTLKRLEEKEDLSVEQVSGDMRPYGHYRNGAVVDNYPNNCQGAMTLNLWDLSPLERGGVTIKNGQVTVPLGGTYLVYSFVDFYEQVGNYSHNCDVDHGIYRFNILDQEEKRLISSIQPRQVSDDRDFNIYSSYVSLLVELKAGDEVSVKVSHPRFIRDTKYNVFGLTMI